MKLVFCWIEEYKNIKEQGFNFGSEYFFEVIKKSNTLEISAKENEAFIADFFTVDSNGFDNITAIVGENGVGKSNLLVILCEILSNGLSFEDGKFSLQIYESNGKYYMNQIGNWKIVNLTKFIIKKEYNTFNAEVVYYNPNIDAHKPLDVDFFNFCTDISSTTLFENDYHKNKFSLENLHPLKIHLLENTRRQIAFNIFWNNSIKDDRIKKDISIPLKLNIDILRESPHVLTLGNGATHRGLSDVPDNFKDFFNKGIDIFWKEEGKRDKSSFTSNEYKEKIKLRFLILLWNNLFVNLSKNPDFSIIQGEVKFIDKQYENYSFNDFVINFLENQYYGNSERTHLKKYFENDDHIFDPSSIVSLIKTFNDLVDLKIITTRERINLSDINKLYLSISVSESELLIESLSNYNNKLKNFFWNDARNREVTEFVFYHWSGLSTGEIAYLNFYSRIYAAKRSISATDTRREINYIYLLIDEGELGFHLQWQKHYILNLIEVIPLILNLPNCKIQLIYATHSPITLSDIPHHHIIYLDKKRDENGQNNCKVLDFKKKHSFGANFYDILQDGFYFKDGFIGSFANKKIQNAIEKINSLSKNKLNQDGIYKAIYKEIDIIDEPLIKIKLHEMLAEKVGKNADKKRMEEQIKYLEQKIKEMGND